MGEKVAIVGSRAWTDHEMVRDYVDSLSDDDVVISGGAKGVDEWAQIYAEKRGLGTIIFMPNWQEHGRSAGLRRNHEIVGACDRLVAFWDGKSTGTQHSIKLARKAEKHVLVFNGPPT